MPLLVSLHTSLQPALLGGLTRRYSKTGFSQITPKRALFPYFVRIRVEPPLKSIPVTLMLTWTSVSDFDLQPACVMPELLW